MLPLNKAQAGSTRAFRHNCETPARVIPEQSGKMGCVDPLAQERHAANEEVQEAFHCNMDQCGLFELSLIITHPQYARNTAPRIRIKEKVMAKVLCVLYADPVGGYPPKYARNDIPHIEKYAGGQTAPTPEQIDFVPGELLGSVSGALGLRKYLESLGHTFIVTSDKDGEDSVIERELPDADIVISQPFWPE